MLLWCNWDTLLDEKTDSLLILLWYSSLLLKNKNLKNFLPKYICHMIWSQAKPNLCLLSYSSLADTGILPEEPSEYIHYIRGSGKGTSTLVRVPRGFLWIVFLPAWIVGEFVRFLLQHKYPLRAYTSRSPFSTYFNKTRLGSCTLTLTI